MTRVPWFGVVALAGVLGAASCGSVSSPGQPSAATMAGSDYTGTWLGRYTIEACDIYNGYGIPPCDTPDTAVGDWDLTLVLSQTGSAVSGRVYFGTTLMPPQGPEHLELTNPSFVATVAEDGSLQCVARVVQYAWFQPVPYGLAGYTLTLTLTRGGSSIGGPIDVFYQHFKGVRMERGRGTFSATRID